ncbi:MAG: hypothetical protein PUA56_03645 [Bacillales bacterium]|nr:hypothetical protein [Bacillales bacterium]
MKKKKNEDIKLNISDKHIPLRIVIFVVSFIIAIGAIGFGVYSCSTKGLENSGWVNFDLSLYNDNDYIGYNNDIRLMYYVDGDKAQVKNTNKLVRDLFIQKAKKVYSLIDSTPDYNYKTKGISYINNHINEKIEIEERLYNILSDALDKTNLNETYSLYSGLINSFWKTNFTLNYSLNKNIDPLLDNKNKADLELIKQACKKENNLKLKLDKEDDKYYATLNVDQEVVSLVDDLSLEANYLDLNSLFNSYYLQEVYQDFINANLTKGYFYAETGEIIFMSDSFVDENNIIIYDKTNKVFPVGIVSSSGACNVSQIRTFGVNNNTNFYSFIHDNQVINRSLYYDYKEGYNNETFTISSIVSKKKLVDLTYMNLYLTLKGDLSLYQEKLIDQEYAAVIKKDEERTIYLSDPESNYKDYGRYINGKYEIEEMYLRKAL